MMVQFIAPAILLLGIFAGIWLNRRDYESLRRELTENMNRQFSEVNRRLGLIESDQKQFFVLTGKMDGRIDEIAKR